MNLLKILTREEPIAGLEISESHLRLALLSASDGPQKIKIEAYAEEPVPKGAIAEGLIKDQEVFIKAVKGLLKKVKLKITYASVSIPADNVYAKVFSFPGSVSGEKLNETMELTIGFQIPLKTSDVYLDWEKIENGAKNEIFLAAAPKNIIQNYTEALSQAGLKTVATEFHQLSLARVLKTEDVPVMVITKGSSKTIAAVIRKGVVRFLHSIPKENVPEKRLEAELKRAVDFYETEDAPITKVFFLNSGRRTAIKKFVGREVVKPEIISPFSENPEIEKVSGKWLISFGAAVRGLIPRSEDALVSLMPVGTEEAYEYQKIITFTKLLADMIMSASIVLAIAFISSWLLLTTVQQNFNEQHGSSVNTPLPIDAAEAEARAKRLDMLLGQTNEIIKTIPKWSMLAEEVKSIVTPEILIKNLSLGTPEANISLSGIAQTRDALNSFKMSMESSVMLSDILIPLTNLELKKEVPFSISFKLKDPSSIYFK
ncbi:MAG: pilus assembly protein PilM [Candidatus Colwellbacteria bacterium]|nr:pilus assembly protein PilM [Candidatus Colwellbacteria bacterium]